MSPLASNCATCFERVGNHYECRYGVVLDTICFPVGVITAVLTDAAVARAHDKEGVVTWGDNIYLHFLTPASRERFIRLLKGSTESVVVSMSENPLAKTA